ncbi:hypothetical protein FRB90_000565 [Tulasnella sp. 427]|nr:hypothetical protein FRB90_000565 [Tulasnella sp. 427]
MSFRNIAIDARFKTGQKTTRIGSRVFTQPRAVTPASCPGGYGLTRPTTSMKTSSPPITKTQIKVSEKASATLKSTLKKLAKSLKRMKLGKLSTAPYVTSYPLPRVSSTVLIMADSFRSNAGTLISSPSRDPHDADRTFVDVVDSEMSDEEDESVMCSACVPTMSPQQLDTRSSAVIPALSEVQADNGAPVAQYVQAPHVSNDTRANPNLPRTQAEEHVLELHSRMDVQAEYSTASPVESVCPTVNETVRSPSPPTPPSAFSHTAPASPESARMAHATQMHALHAKLRLSAQAPSLRPRKDRKAMEDDEVEELAVFLTEAKNKARRHAASLQSRSASPSVSTPTHHGQTKPEVAPTRNLDARAEAISPSSASPISPTSDLKSKRTASENAANNVMEDAMADLRKSMRMKPAHDQQVVRMPQTRPSRPRTITSGRTTLPVAVAKQPDVGALAGSGVPPSNAPFNPATNTAPAQVNNGGKDGLRVMKGSRRVAKLTAKTGETWQSIQHKVMEKQHAQDQQFWNAEKDAEINALLEAALS